MNLKSLKTLLSVSLIFGLSSPALAEDVDSPSDGQYEQAYSKCSDAADTQGNDDNWDAFFNSCMTTEGYQEESEAENNEESDNYQ